MPFMTSGQRHFTRSHDYNYGQSYRLRPSGRRQMKLMSPVNRAVRGGPAPSR